MAIIICISEKFYQAWKPVTERAGGLVLGLSNFHALFFLWKQKGGILSAGEIKRAVPKGATQKDSPNHTPHPMKGGYYG